jgi:hypothetical protein
MSNRAPLLALLLTFTLLVRPAQSQDPMTVIAAVGKVASTVKSVEDLFANNNQDKEQIQDISKSLTQIHQQLSDIESKIDQITDALKQLKVEMHEEFDRQSQIEVKSTIEIVGQHYDTWVKDWNTITHTWKSGKDHPGIPSPSEVLFKLQSASANLRLRDSYASYPVVAMAMVYDRALLKVTGEKLTGVDVRNGFRSYAQYYANALDPGGAGDTVGKHLQEANGRMASLTNDLVARTRTLLCQVSAGKCSYGPYAIVDYWKLQVVSGNLSTGFSFSPGNFRWIALTLGKSIYKPGTVSLPNIPCESNPDDRTYWFHMGEARPDSCPDVLNKESADYNQAGDRSKILTPIVETLGELKSTAEKWSQQPPARPMPAKKQVSKRS